MRVLIATDAWHPQINGVVRSLEQVANAAESLGVGMSVLAPAAFPNVPLPTYREIQLALAMPRQIAWRIDAVQPDYIHIATEGPIGHLVRSYCLRRNRAFTTSFHTKFPEYIAARFPIPERWTYAYLRRFHNAGAALMVTTETLEGELSALGFRNILRWARGVDADLFRPRGQGVLDLPRPISMYVGRVSVEKNLDTFLRLDLPGTKVVVGQGPQLGPLKGRYPDVVFTGAREGEALAELFASADVFVFPSLTDTFGIVLLEALACGVPVAAFPVTGPKDVIGSSGTGVLDWDLKAAVLRALDIPRERCRAYALRHTWRESARQFIDNLQAAHGPVAWKAAA
jgi:glycosyltransferase involved in cell wall biosynthesis